MLFNALPTGKLKGHLVAHYSKHDNKIYSFDVHCVFAIGFSSFPISFDVLI